MSNYDRSPQNYDGCFVLIGIVLLIIGILTFKYYIGIALVIIAVLFFIISSVHADTSEESQQKANTTEEKTIQTKNSKEVSPNPNLEITIDTTRNISSMPEIKFSKIKKNTPSSKVFPLIVVDVETTGTGRCMDKIVEVSALKFDENFILCKQYSTLINPQRPIKPKATAVNHITDDMVKNAPLFSQIRSQFQDFISDCNIAGYNLRFDLEFLYHAGIDLNENVYYYDVYELAESKIPETKIDNYKLSTVCEYYDITLTNAHRSYYDALATAEVLQKIYTPPD